MKDHANFVSFIIFNYVNVILLLNFQEIFQYNCIASVEHKGLIQPFDCRTPNS